MSMQRYKDFSAYGLEMTVTNLGKWLGENNTQDIKWKQVPTGPDWVAHMGHFARLKLSLAGRLQPRPERGCQLPF
ncbi:MAG: hypothetical protein Fur0044_08770 [Anaerolineae bacterium]